MCYTFLLINATLLLYKIQAINTVSISIENSPNNISYLKFRADSFRTLVQKSIDVQMSKANGMNDYKRLWTIEKKKIHPAYSIMFAPYHMLNNHYDESDKTDLKWLCDEFDLLDLKENDIRIHSKLNSTFMNSLDPKIQQKYIDANYSDK